MPHAGPASGFGELPLNGNCTFASSHPQGATTNAQAEADNVSLEIDGVCCYNFEATVTN